MGYGTKVSALSQLLLLAAQQVAIRNHTCHSLCCVHEIKDAILLKSLVGHICWESKTRQLKRKKTCSTGWSFLPFSHYLLSTGPGSGLSCSPFGPEAPPPWARVFFSFAELWIWRFTPWGHAWCPYLPWEQWLHPSKEEHVFLYRGGKSLGQLQIFCSLGCPWISQEEERGAGSPHLVVREGCVNPGIRRQIAEGMQAEKHGWDTMQCQAMVRCFCQMYHRMINKLDERTASVHFAAGPAGIQALRRAGSTFKMLLTSLRVGLKPTWWNSENTNAEFCIRKEKPTVEV